MKAKTDYKTSMMFLRVLIIVVAIFIGLTTSASAQGICVPEAMTVTAVSGRAVSQLDRGEAPLPQATVTLLKDVYNGRVVSEIAADANGNFRLNHIKQGEYVLKVSFPNLATYYGRVQVKTSKAQTNSQEIFLVIGADFRKPCGGSYAEVRSKKNNDSIYN